MEYSRFKECLADERCGLYFLVGLDQAGTSGDADRLTVHAAVGILGEEQAAFIRGAVAAIDPVVDVHIRLHSPGDLYSPSSLESFAGLFDHDSIVADPTGAFARVPSMLKLARTLRLELGGALDRILWRTQDAAMVCVLGSHAAAIGPSGDSFVPEERCAEIRSLVKQLADPIVNNAVSTVHVVAKVPAGSYVPVDQGSVVAPVATAAPRRRSRLAARLAAFAALIGFGALSTTATATTRAALKQDLSHPPGLTALAGLTTLGENSLGMRNHYQAVGGLRLYFGDAGVLLAANFSPERASPLLDHLLKGHERDASKQGKPQKEPPTRVAYAA